MNIHPTIAAMRRQIAGPILIGLQIALTMAIVCNALFIIGQRISHISQPTGLKEDNLFWITQQLVRTPGTDVQADADQLDAMQREDLNAIRSLPNVESATAISTLPLLNSSREGSISLDPDQKNARVRTVFYFGDENMLATLGLHLVSGRAFDANDIVHGASSTKLDPSVVIITADLAHALFANEPALGKAIYVNGGAHLATIVGVVERLQVSTNHSWASSFAYNSTLVPIPILGSTSTYAVRAKPGQLAMAMKSVPEALYGINRLRIMDDKSVQSYADIRAAAYRSDLGMAIVMAAVCAILIAVTAAGIIGLSSFWVNQRRRQIGIRRALGARKTDILYHFHFENIIIGLAGAVTGIALAEGLNVWLMQNYEMDRLPVIYVLIGFVTVVVLGQIAVFAPARRASMMTPVSAMHGHARA